MGKPSGVGSRWAEAPAEGGYRRHEARLRGLGWFYTAPTIRRALAPPRRPTIPPISATSSTAIKISARATIDVEPPRCATAIAPIAQMTAPA